MQWKKISVFQQDVYIHMNNALKRAASYLCGWEEELCETRFYENLAQHAHLLLQDLQIRDRAAQRKAGKADPSVGTVHAGNTFKLRMFLASFGKAVLEQFVAWYWSPRHEARNAHAFRDAHVNAAVGAERRLNALLGRLPLWVLVHTLTRCWP